MDVFNTHPLYYHTWDAKKTGGFEWWDKSLLASCLGNDNGNCSGRLSSASTIVRKVTLSAWLTDLQLSVEVPDWNWNMQSIVSLLNPQEQHPNNYRRRSPWIQKPSRASSISSRRRPCLAREFYLRQLQHSDNIQHDVTGSRSHSPYLDRRREC